MIVRENIARKELNYMVDCDVSKTGIHRTDINSEVKRKQKTVHMNEYEQNENNEVLVKKEALLRLIKQLQEAQEDPISYSADEIYKLFSVEK